MLQVIGVVRVLMRSRKQPAYEIVLNFLKILAPNWNPMILYSDFEKAEMNAFRIEFPRCRVVGCLWHYGVVSIFKFL